MRLLVVPGYCETLGEANWICLREVLKALEKYPDLDVDIAGALLSKEDSRSAAKNKIELLKKIIHWPVISPRASEQCYADILKHLNHTAYDAMLVMHMPYDGVLAAVRAKRKHPETKLFLYELDPITYEIDKQRKSLGRYLYFMRELAERRTFRMCDVVFHMECNRNKYSQKKYDAFREKFVYLDFPLIGNTQDVQSVKEKTGTGHGFRFVYTGKLMSHFRSPMYLLQVLAEVGKKKDLQVLFFSQGDCEKAISEFAQDHPFIVQRGYVSKDVLKVEMDSSDCLINIGNKMSDMLPSKLLTYVEMGMPILHVKKQDRDACIPYLEKYELALIIDEADPVEVSAEKTLAFMDNCAGMRLDGQKIRETFYKNTPDYSAEKIYDRIQ